tara:strand:+ start:409 stop:900 length:492 start_codon:yes stop_codon:yes gene_type:complete
MSLETILYIYPIYTNIIKYLSDTDIDILCNIYPRLRCIFDHYGYKRCINIYYTNIDEYIKSLEEYERHKIFIKEIRAYNMINPFAFLPKSYGKIYSLYNCKLIVNIPSYIKHLNIYDNEKIDIKKILKECKNLESLTVSSANRIINKNKYKSNIKYITFEEKF